MLHDVSDLRSNPRLVEEVESRFGPLHILVNNAGNHLKKPAVETTDDEFAVVLQTHLFGAFALTRECARRMMARRGGAIKNIFDAHRQSQRIKTSSLSMGAAVTMPKRQAL